MWIVGRVWVRKDDARRDAELAMAAERPAGGEEGRWAADARGDCGREEDSAMGDECADPDPDGLVDGLGELVGIGRGSSRWMVTLVVV